VEYAMEAVKQGSATVGIKSKTHAVLVSGPLAVKSQVLKNKTLLQEPILRLLNNVSVVVR
jgi:20S proteasome subunit alpha 6